MCGAPPGRRPRRLRPPARPAPVHLADGPAARLPGEVRPGGAPQARGRAGADRRHVLVVGGDPRLQPPGAEPGGARSAAPHVARDVRRDHAPARGGTRGAPAGSGARRPGAGLLLRLRFRRRRGGDQDGVPVLEEPRRKAPGHAAHGPRRLSRRHLRRDVGLRPGDGDARPLPGAPAGAALCASPGAGLRRGVERTVDRRVREAADGEQRAHRRRDPGADRPGGGGDVDVLPALSPARAAALRPGGGAADPRRDRHRLRADRQALRLRTRRRGAGHPLPRQGADGRLRQPGRHAGDAGR